MQLSYGSYFFPPNTTDLGLEMRTRLNEGGQPVARIRRMSVRGYLLTSVNGDAAAQQADLTVQENRLKAALAIPYQDLVFRTDAGLVSSEVLTNAGSITGVVITEGPHFRDTKGPQYATIRTFEFVAEAEYPAVRSQLLLLSFVETVSLTGGYPLYVFRRNLLGAPQKQLVWPATEYEAIQSGSAVGYRAYPNPAPMAAPYALKESPRITHKSPRRRGNGYEAFETTWEYHFADVAPLVILPNFWRV